MKIKKCGDEESILLRPGSYDGQCQQPNYDDRGPQSDLR